MRPVERVLETLEVTAGPEGKGEYLAFCPAHDDRNTPHLRLREAEDGSVLLHCFAGCSQDEVLAALEERGVPGRDLFPRAKPGHAGEGGGGGCPSPRDRVQPCNPRATSPALRGGHLLSTATLLDEMRRQDIRLEVDGLTLRVDAPEEATTDELRHALREHKRALIRHLERERLRLEAADRRGLVIKWAKEPGYIALHDPTTGEWHEVRETECFASMGESARARRRFGGVRR